MVKKSDKKDDVDYSKMDIRIVILQRGWVMVGHYKKDGSDCYLNNGHVIRIWGTSRGLGEIAHGGPTSATKLDPVPEVQFHELTVIASMKCDASKWAEYCDEKWMSVPA